VVVVTVAPVVRASLMVVTAPPLERSVTKVARLLPLRMYGDSMA